MVICYYNPYLCFLYTLELATNSSNGSVNVERKSKAKTNNKSGMNIYEMPFFSVTSFILVKNHIKMFV